MFQPPKPGEYRILNPQLAKFALPSTVATKLVAKLTPDQMQSDAWIDWLPARSEFPTLYSREALIASTADVWFGITVAGLLLTQLVAPRIRRSTVIKAVVATMTLAIVCASLHFATGKTTDVRIIRGHRFIAIAHFKNFDGALEQFALERTNDSALSFHELTNALPEYIRNGGMNCFTHDPLIHDTSPGNITLRKGTNATTVIWYDINANPHELTRFTNAQPQL